MKTAFELFSEEYGTDHLTGEIYDYTPILEQFGEILIRVDDEDYNGDSYLIYKKDGKYGYLIFGWGSCSGCDALQGCDTIQEVQELMNSLYNGITWFDSLAALQDYFAEKDWSLEYCYHIETFKKFRLEVKNLKDGFNFNSRPYTTIEQSQRLIDLGLKVETADCCHWYCMGCELDESQERSDTPAWSLHRLIEMIPEHLPFSIYVGHLCMNRERVYYTDGKRVFETWDNGWTIYDNIISCIEWLIKEGFFNKEYLCEK